MQNKTNKFVLFFRGFQNVLSNMVLIEDKIVESLQYSIHKMG